MQPSPPDSYLLESPRRMSDCLLWNIQRTYYEQQGLEAWRSGVVPHYGVSNPFVARTYADIVMGYLRDCREAGLVSPERPLYVVELGAGSGRFSYHFLHAFLPLLSESSLRDAKVKVVLTDCVRANLEFWLSHPKFQPFF